MKDALDQGAFSRAGHACDHIESAQQEVGCNALKVVSFGVFDRDFAHALSPVFGNWNAPFPREVICRQ